MSRHRKREPHLHAAAVMLKRGINEFFDIGESHDFIELPVNLGLARAKDGPAQEDIFAASELRVKASPYFEQGSHAPADFGEAPGGFGHTGEDLEKGALARPVTADDSHHFALADLERDVLQRPDVRGRIPV